MTATLPLATPIGWDPATTTPGRIEPATGHQPTLFDRLTTEHRATGRSGLDPAVTARVRQLAVVTVEVLSGRRPPTQLARWTTEPVHAHLTMVARRNRGRVGLQVASVHCQAPSDTVIESVLRVLAAGRSVAMGFRLQRQRARWVCTAWDLRPDDLVPR